ncbi:mechanosensitive ion channel family protein [bacterium]|nr:mechanosensitive ion channel family protein [bacterium]
MILKNFNQDMGSNFVPVGMESMAFALAAIDTMTNMIAGFRIMMDQPFWRGDRILLESGEKGEIFDIRLRGLRFLFLKIY